MATLNLRNPNGYDGSPGTKFKQGIVRLATDEEALAGVANNIVVTPAQLATISTGANFASPPALGFGSTTPRPVHATTLSALGAVTINTTGAGVTSINTGGTGALIIGNATGNTSLTGTLTASGNITTNGNIVHGTAGSKDVYTSVASTTTAGANSAGKVTLVSGTATVSTTAITAASQVRLYRQGVGATGAAALGILSLGTITAGVSFIINSVTAASAIANQTTDVSVIGWEIVN